ncbi:Receptor ligand binding region family protein [Candidatus Desulfosporosinus infrequens]|uniref:Receptor ligand binding region family protein n=1 Tax=Candidatus Desulfosporosinus infrequens TaxID=2043169 RepID=A0A2U3KCY3_9FIRM|nr:Receptor ligand binding region family protein [Candidatus Desulfosporosinus infrequens]
MKKRFHLRYQAWLVISSMILGVLLTGCGQATPAPSGNSGTASGGSKLSVKVGYIDSLSGPAAAYGKSTEAGIKIAIDEVAKAGGPTIDLVERDDNFKPDVAEAMAKELVMNQNINILVGTVNSAGALAVSKFAKDNKVLFINSDSMSEKITGAQGHRYVFSIVGNTAMIGKAGAYQMSKMPYKRYWLAGSDYEFGHSVVNSVWTNLQQLKPDVQKIGESWWKVGESDFSSYINAIRAAKPDAVYVGSGGGDTVALLKAIKQSGLNTELPIFIHNSTDFDSLRPLGQDAPEGIYGTTFYRYDFPDNPTSKAFAETYKKATGNYPGFAGLNGYLTIKFLAAAIEKSKSTDNEKVIDALEGLSLDTPAGKGTIRKEDHQLMLPMVFGKTVKSPTEPYLITTDNVLIPADQIMPSVADVLKTRTK